MMAGNYDTPDYQFEIPEGIRIDIALDSVTDIDGYSTMDFTITIHPPTNYFPLIVHDSLMIEPTETESKQTLDAFADALIRIADEAHTDSGVLKSAPHNTPVGRLDEVKAARELVICCAVGAFPEE